MLYIEKLWKGLPLKCKLLALRQHFHGSTGFTENSGTVESLMGGLPFHHNIPLRNQNDIFSTKKKPKSERGYPFKTKQITLDLF